VVGVFIYQPGTTPALGNPPIVSETGASFDPYGNPVLPGVTSYAYPVATGSLATQLVEGLWNIWFWSGSAWVQQVSTTIGDQGTGDATFAIFMPDGTGIFLNQVTGTVQAFGADTNTYDVQRLTLYTTATQTFNSTSGTAITRLTAPVAAGTYKVRARLRFTTAAAAGNAEINFTGPATSLCELGGSWRVPGSSGSSLEQETTGLGGVFTSFGLNSGGQAFYLDGIVTFSAAGTLVMQGTCTSAADTWTTVPGCTFELEPATASL
jgi:hypothetical protein